MCSSLAEMRRPDVYLWYEGAEGLPRKGATFMRKIFDEALIANQEASLYLYSLRGWNFTECRLNSMPHSNALGEAINALALRRISCLYSYGFFRFCAQFAKDCGLYRFFQRELPQKEWLFNHSKDKAELGITVGEFLSSESSIFDCIAYMDVNRAYSVMQYVEGLYLVRESIKKAISDARGEVEVAFLLPSGEESYYDNREYQEFSDDLERMLEIERIENVQVSVKFCTFQYKENKKARPYIDSYDKNKVQPQQIQKYLPIGGKL